MRDSESKTKKIKSDSPSGKNKEIFSLKEK